MPPPVWWALAAGAQWVVGGRRPLTPARAIPAAVLAAGSLALAATAVRGFGAAHTTLDPHHPEDTTALVTTGAHGFSRNPIYLAFAGSLVSHAVALGSWRSLVGPVAFVGVINVVQIPAEERTLAERFGPAYAQYRSRVPRWLGRVR